MNLGLKVDLIEMNNLLKQINSKWKFHFIRNLIILLEIGCKAMRVIRQNCLWSSYFGRIPIFITENLSKKKT